MAINLGPEAFEAITRLKNSSDWRAVVTALQAQMSVYMHRSLEVPVTDRNDATGYARALRDVVAHVELIEHPEERNPKPAVRMQREPARV